MRGTSSLHRSLRKATVDSHRQFHSRDQAGRYYELGEREQQFQHPISGHLGFLPVETTFKILFDIAFVWDAGVRRDSQLGEPLFRPGFTFASVPKGTVPYAHVSEWIQDDDLNYIGAKVTVGIHNPLVAAQQTEGLKYKGMVHCTFQGYGMPLDAEGSSDAGSDAGSDSNAPGFGGGGVGAPTGVGPGGSPGGPPALPGGPSGPDYNPGDSRGPLPVYPAGPLGGTGWTTVHTWMPFGSLSDWEVPAKEGALKVAGDDGRLTAADPNDVTFLPEDFPGWIGDKYAAKWTAPGKVRGGYKIRVHLRLTPIVGDMAFPAIVVNMVDRQRGLAFWWNADAMGWTTDLRLLGDVQWAGMATHWNSTQPMGRSPDGQDPNLLLPTSDPIIVALSPEESNAYSRWVAEYLNHKDVWVELWRTPAGPLQAALYNADPATGAAPAYISNLPLAPYDPHFGPGVPGYFGWTMSHFPSGPPAFPFFPKRGILETTLFKES